MQKLKMPEVLRLARLAAQEKAKDWTPHLRDDQALQLAVKLGMTIEVDTPNNRIRVNSPRYATVHMTTTAMKHVYTGAENVVLCRSVRECILAIAAREGQAMEEDGVMFGYKEMNHNTG